MSVPCLKYFQYFSSSSYFHYVCVACIWVQAPLVLGLSHFAYQKQKIHMKDASAQASVNLINKKGNSKVKI